MLHPHVRRIQSNDGRHITERHVLLGQHTEAVQMLLETDAKDASFYVDSLRACVIAAVRTPETAQNTIKLVAMNLIAASNLAGDFFHASACCTRFPARVYVYA
jgi:hypothetical protein